MLTLPPSVRLYLAAGATDLRKGFDSLAGLVREVLGRDPLSGHVFVFCNRRRNRVRLLVWDGTGLWLMTKRLERGKFAWPESLQPVPRLSVRGTGLRIQDGHCSGHNDAAVVHSIRSTDLLLGSPRGDEPCRRRTRE